MDRRSGGNEKVKAPSDQLFASGPLEMLDGRAVQVCGRSKSGAGKTAFCLQHSLYSCVQLVPEVVDLVS